MADMTEAKKSGTGRRASRKTGGARREAGRGRLRSGLVWVARGLGGLAGLVVVLVLLFAVVNPPFTPYMLAESRRQGGLVREWVAFEQIAPVMARSIVAAEDANFCNHWGFDLAAIRAAIDGGKTRGASTITQQVVKNLFLWQGRSWPRKALEALITPLIELVWTKRRILEVYMNIAETGTGRFGVAAAARDAFDLSPDRLSAQQAARIAALLPDPKSRSAANPGPSQRRRAAAIADGAATIGTDGRAACFED